MKFFKWILLPPYFFILRIARGLGLMRTPVIKICISTNKNFAARTIPDLYKSLTACGFNAEDIYIVEGGHDTEGVSTERPNHFFVAHNSFDLTALITLSQLPVNTDYWFLIHDTCVAGPRFKKRIANIPHYLPEVIALRNFPSMNIGAYRTSYLERTQDILQSMKNTDNSAAGLRLAKLKAIQGEDILFRQPDIRNKIWVYNPWRLQRNEEYRIADTAANGYYNNRITEYFPQVDLYKYKANYVSNTSVVVEL